MANYGAYARRAAARGGSTLTDVDIYKLFLLCKTERGIVDADGNPFVQDEIYSMDDFYKKCGGFNSSYYGSYIAQSFYDELDNDINCEMKVISPVDAAAVQATYAIMDGAGSAVKIFDVKAGRLGLNDKSAFGNKIGIKITQTSEVTMKLSTDITVDLTYALLDSVDNLAVGNYIQIADGTHTEVRSIVTLDTALKKVTFAILTYDYTATLTTVSRLDWKLEVALKDGLGNYQKVETWEGPFAKSNTIGLAEEVNNVESGSDYVILAVNAANASAAEDQIPAALTTWTALASGADGSAASDGTWLTMANSYVVSQVFTIMLAPESSSITHNTNMLSFVTDGYKGMYYAQAANAANEVTLKNFGASMRGGIKFGMLPSDKWIKVNDPTTSGKTKDIPMVGIAAAFWFNVYTRFGEAKVAAGNKAEMVLKASGKLLDTNGLVHDDSDGKGGRLIKNYSINISRFTRGKGITINSARTFSTDDGYKYQNQVMQWLLYSRSIVAYLRLIEQDPSGYKAQESHRNAVYAYMKKKFNAGAFFVGQKEDGTLTEFKDVVVIINDFTINTLANIANGIEETFLQFTSCPPIEEAILSLASASVTTVTG